ncbi:MAG: trehalose-6-phosphate synthase [Rhodospirillales bacterium]|nr:trehalose-6-phosphate synthase [Rhodospirillales bacterium]
MRTDTSHIIVLKGLAGPENDIIVDHMKKKGKPWLYQNPRINHWAHRPTAWLKEQADKEKLKYRLIVPWSPPSGADAEIDPDLKEIADRLNITFVPVPREMNELAKGFDAYAKGFWHNTPDDAFPYDEDEFKAFRGIDTIMADATVSYAKTEMAEGRKPVVNIQNKDFYFAVGDIRDRMPHVPITFFLHQAVTGSLKSLEQMERLDDVIDSLIQADTLFFHSRRQADNFARLVVERGRTFTRKIDHIPLGVDIDLWKEKPLSLEAQRFSEHALDMADGRKILAAVDRCDRFKNIPERMKMVDAYLERFPDEQDKIVLMQAVPLSNGGGKDNPYAALNNEIMSTMEAINQKWEARGIRAPIIKLNNIRDEKPDDRLNYDEIAGLSRALTTKGGVYVVSSTDEGYHMGIAQCAIMRDSLYKNPSFEHSGLVGHWVSINAGFYDQNDDICHPLYPNDIERSVKSLREALRENTLHRTINQTHRIVKFLKKNTPEDWARRQLEEGETILERKPGYAPAMTINDQQNKKTLG